MSGLGAPAVKSASVYERFLIWRAIFKGSVLSLHRNE